MSDSYQKPSSQDSDRESSPSWMTIEHAFLVSIVVTFLSGSYAVRRGVLSVELFVVGLVLLGLEFAWIRRTRSTTTP